MMRAKNCESKLIGAIKIRSEDINLIKKDVNDFKFMPTLTGEIFFQLHDDKSDDGDMQ